LVKQQLKEPAASNDAPTKTSALCVVPLVANCSQSHPYVPMVACCVCENLQVDDLGKPWSTSAVLHKLRNCKRKRTTVWNARWTRIHALQSLQQGMIIEKQSFRPGLASAELCTIFEWDSFENIS